MRDDHGYGTLGHLDILVTVSRVRHFVELMSWRLFSIWVVVLVYATLGKSLQSTKKVDKVYVEKKRNPTPSSYADAILSTSEETHTKFYFPGHGGGKFAPWFLRKRFGENVFKMDLPELASTDNLHSPVVRNELSSLNYGNLSS